MSNYLAISSSWTSSWSRANNWHHASADSLAPLVAAELGRAAASVPIAFVRGKSLYPCAVVGIRPGRNVFVTSDGRWVGSYVPAQYRAYPFLLAKGKDDHYVLTVDMDSGLIDQKGDFSFFESNGEISKPVRAVLNFLQQVEKSRKETLRLCAALEAEGLIVPWEITINSKDGQTKINDLYRIDEAKLNSLDPAALARLHQAGALPVAYCQLLSMQHIHTLAKLADAHAKIEAAQPQPEKPNRQSGVSFLGDDGKIDFSGFS